MSNMIGLYMFGACYDGKTNNSPPLATSIDEDIFQPRYNSRIPLNVALHVFDLLQIVVTKDHRDPFAE